MWKPFEDYKNTNLVILNKLSVVYNTIDSVTQDLGSNASPTTLLGYMTWDESNSTVDSSAIKQSLVSAPRNPTGP